LSFCLLTCLVVVLEVSIFDFTSIHNLGFILLVKSHLNRYPLPLSLSTFWNFGFLLGMSFVFQLITGVLLSLYYSTSLPFMSVYYLMRELYSGDLFRLFHVTGASFVFLLLYVHMGRGLYYGSSLYCSISWYTGVIIFLCSMGIAFMGYVLPYGQMSYWGATVITNLLTPFPSVLDFLSGGFSVSGSTIKRFFIFHFILPFLVLGLVVVHLFHLHYVSSNHPLMSITNNKVSFYPSVVLKDILSLLVLVSISSLQVSVGMYFLAHPDNNVEACSLVTPLHIVPEWYFLCQYAMLKSIPNKNAGFICLLMSLLMLLVLPGLISTMSILVFYVSAFWILRD